MGILVNTGFDVGSSNPIDSRTVKNTTDERDELVTDGLVYENLKVYCKDTQTEYRWTGTDWEEVGTGGSSSGGDLDLTDYQKKTDNTLTTTDKTVTGAINEVNGNLLDTVGFSADYKNIILNRKSGLNPYTIPITAIINNAKLIELGDIDATDIGNGKILVYDAATQKHKYVNSSITDELVKMDSATDAKYLSDLIDKSTVINDNGVLKVKKLDGQEVTITEINYLKGLTMNVMDLVSAFANGGVKVLNTPLNTASELDTMDRTSFIEGISYIVYVLADETHAGAKTTYLVDKTNTTFFGNADSQRNFTTNPIDLANEVTGKLGTSNIDVDSLWSLLTIDDTYKTLTTTDNVFGTHGAKAMYDELTTSIGEKANDTDLTTHTGDTDIHITSVERTKWNKIDNKIDKTDIATTLDNTVTDKQVASALLTKTELDKTNAKLGEKASKEEIKNFKNVHTSPTTLGITIVNGQDNTRKAFDALGVGERYQDFWTNSQSYLRWGIPAFYGDTVQIEIVKISSNYGVCTATTDKGITLQRYIDTSKTKLLDWKGLANMDKVEELSSNLDELFQSVSNGKTSVANAITGKGVSTSTTATFATMATNISKIGGSKEETKSYNNTSAGIAPITLTFSANVLGIKQVIPPTYSSRITTQTSADMFTINGKELILYVTGEGTWKVTALIQA